MRMDDLRAGQAVRAFHPRMYGAVVDGEIVDVGGEYVQVVFPSFGPRVYTISPNLVVTAATPPAAETVA